MTTLTAKRRRRLPASAFAYPGTRRYPIHDKAHARNALARAAQKGTFGSYAHVAAAVRRRYPTITTSATTTSGRRRTPRARSRKGARRTRGRRKTR